MSNSAVVVGLVVSDTDPAIVVWSFSEGGIGASAAAAKADEGVAAGGGGGMSEGVAWNF